MMKRGSALLVVLGMLAFMVISAVAFSAFMRYSRLPSSYLRRTSSSRHLVRAALAEAIDMVDAYIADNPHPGVGSATINYPRNGSYSSSDPFGFASWRNTWKNRVFIGQKDLVSAADTVSTLTLEGLAYLPPALVNEVRYYSRHSIAAKWRSFSYDSGRYAFCAVDVSDCFNVNKIPADIGRGSMPENRLSLAYVFENADHNGYVSGAKPSDWDRFMENYVAFDFKSNPWTPFTAPTGPSGSQPSTLPLVSVADLNLAVNKNGGTIGKYFPFASFAKGDSDELVPYGNGTENAEMLSRMNFVTDGIFPGAGGTGDSDDYDLSDKESQPFTREGLAKNNMRRIGDIVKESSKGAVRLRSAISRLGLVTLFDYLDEDRVPVSLAIPSVERVPMVCGIEPHFEGSQISVLSKMKRRSSEDETSGADLLKTDYPDADPPNLAPANGLTRKVYYRKIYTLAMDKFAPGIRQGSVKALVVRPYRREMDEDRAAAGGFKIDGHVEFFLTVGGFGLRTENQGDVLHLTDSDMSKADYDARTGVLHLPLAEKMVSSSRVDGEADAVEMVEWPMMSNYSQVERAVNGNPLMTVTYVQAQKAVVSGTDGNGDPVWEWREDGTECSDAVCGMPPLKPDGTVHDHYKDSAELKSYLNGNSADNVRLRMAVWLRVRNADGKTVDLVPACMQDDKNFNNIDNYNTSREASILNDSVLGKAYPVMRLDCGTVGFDFKDSKFEGMTAVPVDVQQKGLLCCDPRWNWAPENWFEHTPVTKEEWLKECGKGVSDGGGEIRDTDIFIATSDSGYMQSVYELAFLPRLAGLNFGRLGNELWGNVPSASSRSTWANAREGCQHWRFMWKTYYPYARALPLPDPAATAAFDDFETLGGSAGFVNDGGGPKVNPYTDDLNVMMAAFANTPESWWSAAAIAAKRISESNRKADKFNERYAFSPGNDDAKFDWDDLEDIADGFISKVHNDANGGVDGWVDAYDDLWASDGGDKRKLMGVTLEGDTCNLYGVDRKFLYGYWRECFAAKQQLFLVFVRAEPMMMGGGAIGQTPPQLGGRAVALVWRNPYRGSKPYAPSGGSVPENAPHQTRVLFYRQFD